MSVTYQKECISLFSFVILTVLCFIITVTGKPHLLPNSWRMKSTTTFTLIWITQMPLSESTLLAENNCHLEHTCFLPPMSRDRLSTPLSHHDWRHKSHINFDKSSNYVWKGFWAIIIKYIFFLFLSNIFFIS